MEKIQAIITLEILGRPVEHLKEALNLLLSRLGSENGVKIKSKKSHEPILVENSKDLFTTFAELELEFDSLSRYLGILFAYMPSHVEIISPEKLFILNHELNDVGNRLMQRLHEYDAITKNAMVEREFILKRLQEVAPEEFKKLTGQEIKSPKINKKNTKKKS